MIQSGEDFILNFMHRCFLFHPTFQGTLESYGLNRLLQPTYSCSMTVTTKFVVTAVTTKLVVTPVMTKLVLTAVTTKLVVAAITTKLVVSAYF